MAHQTTGQLMDWLVDKQFLNPGQAGEIRPRLASLADGHALARLLVEKGWLTPYQANQILQDKGDNLVLGNYRLLERVGEGAMGQVYKAWNRRLERVVAVKTIHKEHVASSKAMERFRREIEAASNLEHRNIVLVRDADEVDGRPFMVMDYIDGIDLSRMVKEKGPLPVAQAAECIRQAALGLQHALERGVVHRDIKPGNLLVTRAGPDQGTVKILDFGLARFESERSQKARLTMIGGLLGTVDYIAPEQAENAQNADIRADIFSLGCSFYFLLTGKAPFTGGSVVEKISARLLEEAPSARRDRPEIPEALDAILRKMMARAPGQRYQEPREIAVALEPFAKVPSDKPGVERAAVVIPPTQVPASTGVLDRPVERTPGGLLLAQPRVTASAPPAAGETGGAFVLADGSGIDMPLGPAAFPASSTPAKRKRRPSGPGVFTRTSNLLLDPANRRYVAIGSVTAVLGLLLGICLLSMIGGGTPGGPKGYPPGAALELEPLDALTFGGASRRKPVIVRIRREKFSGPVKVFVTEPDGRPWRRDGINISPTELVIPPERNAGEMALTVSFGIPAIKGQLKVVAVAENLRDETTLPLIIRD